MKLRLAILVGLVIASVAVLRLLTPSPARQRIAEPIPSASPNVSASSPTAPALERKAIVESIERALKTPIAFHGRVVDQNGAPVPAATVNCTALDKFDASGSQYQSQADANGNFAITGISGAVLSVGVRKDGYYMVDGKSAYSFAYAVGPDSTRQEPPTKDNPAVFVLQKMGVAEPLIYISSRTYRIPRDGTPVEVDLRTGILAAQGNLRIQAWTNDNTKNVKQHYDWRWLVSVPNGGLVKRDGPFDFEAPVDGYKASDEIVMPQTSERWQPQAQRQYFLKLNSGLYARVHLKMVAHGNHFLRLESHMNPSGSRNLEFDPAKVIPLP